MYDDVNNIIEAITIDENFYPNIIKFLASNGNYRTFVKLKNDELVEMKSIEQAIEHLQ